MIDRGEIDQGERQQVAAGNETFKHIAPGAVRDREQVPIIDYIDLRFDERVYVRPARERRTPATGSKTPAKSARPTQTG